MVQYCQPLLPGLWLVPANHGQQVPCASATPTSPRPPSKFTVATVLSTYARVVLKDTTEQQFGGIISGIQLFHTRRKAKKVPRKGVSRKQVGGFGAKSWAVHGKCWMKRVESQNYCPKMKWKASLGFTRVNLYQFKPYCHSNNTHCA